MNRPKTEIRMLCCLLLLTGFHPLKAATITAKSVSFVDVSNAVALCSPGDTVQMPAGTNSWTQTLTLNGISLKGSGTNSTTINDETPRSGGSGIQLIAFLPVANIYSEMSGFTVQVGVTNTSINYSGCMVISCNSTNWRVHDMVFDRLGSHDFVMLGDAYGVFDHCTFLINGGAMDVLGDQRGDISWAAPANYGSANALYIEDCLFIDVIVNGGGAVMDGNGGARTVFRHNTVQNCVWYNHGTETSGRARSMRSYEIYNNTFVTTNNTYLQWYLPIEIRGGTGVIFSNTVSGYAWFASLNYYRATDPVTPPFGGASGINPFDSNGPVLLSGTYSGTNGATSFCLTNAGWTTNQWYGYTLLNTNSGVWGICTGNSSDTMTFKGPRSSQYQFVINNGDVYQLRLVYPQLDQPGVGSGNLLGGNGNIRADWGPVEPVIDSVVGVAAWSRQVSEPIYGWANTLNGGAGNIGNSGYPNIQENRDYYNGTAKPGYTPYVYPHPLAVVAGVATNPPPRSLTPPSDLSVKPPGQ